MRNFFFIIIVFTNSIVFSQISLGKHYDLLITDILKSNNAVAKISYQKEPISVTFSQEPKLTEYTKNFVFYNKICVFENHRYPVEQFDSHLRVSTISYGTPTITFENGYDLYYWKTDSGLIISLTKKFNTMSKKIGTSITFNY